MYVESSPAARRSAETPRRRGDHRKPTRQSTAVAARRTRLDDAIVSQWLLEQLPADRRHGLPLRHVGR
jgi:hypothetical protein